MPSIVVPRPGLQPCNPTAGSTATLTTELLLPKSGSAAEPPVCGIHPTVRVAGINGDQCDFPARDAGPPFRYSPPPAGVDFSAPDRQAPRREVGRARSAGLCGSLRRRVQRITPASGTVPPRPGLLRSTAPPARDSPPPGGCGLLPSIPVPDRGWICGHAMILAARVRARPEATRRSFLPKSNRHWSFRSAHSTTLPRVAWGTSAAGGCGFSRATRTPAARSAAMCSTARRPFLVSAPPAGVDSSPQPARAPKRRPAASHPTLTPLPIHPPPAGVGFYGASLGTGGWVCTHAIHLRFAVRRLQRRRGIHSPEVGERARGRSAFHPTLHVAWGTSAAGGRGSRAGLGAHRWMANQPFRRQRRAATDPASRERSRLLGRRPMRELMGPTRVASAWFPPPSAVRAREVQSVAAPSTPRSTGREATCCGIQSAAVGLAAPWADAGGNEVGASWERHASPKAGCLLDLFRDHQPSKLPARTSSGSSAGGCESHFGQAATASPRLRRELVR